MVTHRFQAARLRVRGPVKHRLLQHSSLIAYYHYKTALYLRRVSKPPPKARYKPLTCSNSKRLTGSPIPIPSSSRVSQEPKTPTTVVRVSLNPRISIYVHPPRGPSRGRVSPIVSSKSSSSVTLCPPHRRPQERSGSRGGEGSRGDEGTTPPPRSSIELCFSRSTLLPPPLSAPQRPVGTFIDLKGR